MGKVAQEDKGGAVENKSLETLSSLTHFMVNADSVVGNSNNDALKEMFWQLGELEGGTFVARCFIVHELYSRVNSDDQRVSLQQVSNFLDVSYIYIRQMHSVYQDILRPIRSEGGDIPELPAGFFIEAAGRSKKYGLTPLEAINHALACRVDNRGYTREDFREDIRRGLRPDGEVEDTRPSCINCEHMYKAGEDSVIVLMSGERKLADGPGDGTYYCVPFQITKDLILSRRSLHEQAENCIAEHMYKQRG